MTLEAASTTRLFIDTRDTRYHIVRVAAIQLGWSCEDGDREDVPSVFHGLPCRSSEIQINSGEVGENEKREKGDSEKNTHRLGLRKQSASPKKKAECVVPQIVWQDKSITRDTLSRLTYYQRINHFLGMNCIARKALLFKRLMAILRKKVRPALSANNSSSSIAASASDLFVYQRLCRCLETFYPESFSTISDYAALEQFYRQRAGVVPSSPDKKSSSSLGFFIIKPNTSCEGKGIRVTPYPLDALTEEEKLRKVESVVQVYVDRPLLLEGKKFDLRIYVLLTSVCPPPKTRVSLRTAAFRARENSSVNTSSLLSLEPGAADKQEKKVDPLSGIHLFVHESGLVRVCALPYESPTEQNCNQSGIHLTNYAVNKRLDDFTVATVAQDKNARDEVDTKHSEPLYTSGNKRDLQYMEEVINSIPSCELSEEAMDHLMLTYGGKTRWECVRQAIDECITLTILSGVDVLRREYHGAVDRSRQSRDGGAIACFELLGFDVMLRSRTLQPVLMEVNHSPSLFCDTEFDFHLKQTVLKDCLQIVGCKTPPLSECLPKTRYEKAVQKISALQQKCSTNRRTEKTKNECSLLNAEDEDNNGAACLPEVTQGTGWRSLLPTHKNGLWSAEQQATQELMLKLSTSL